MRFVKMESLGNDFLVLDVAQRPGSCGALVRALCHRKRGVGADGVLLILPGEGGAAARVEVWNADGSEAQISGNGLRCAARWLGDSGRAAGETPLATRAGTTRVLVPQDPADAIRVPLGPPRFHPRDIPMIAPGERFVEAKLEGVPIPVTALSVGNPHAVLFVDGPVAAARLGPIIEGHPAFPERTNVEFVRVDAPSRLTVIVWERGVGPTASSGTGAAASLAAAVVTGRADRLAAVAMEGGTIACGWDDAGVWTEGPARRVFEGEWRI